MAEIETHNRIVYYAPTARKSFLTKRAAAYAEARAMITRKYPTERQEKEDGRVVNGGWHWTEDERLQSVFSRLSKRIYRRTIGVK